LIAGLLVLFFDPKFQSATTGNSSDVGSTARMQQWLSLFFPAFCLKSKMTRDAVLGAIEDALKRGVSKKGFPVVKVVEYVCEVVTVAAEEVTNDQPTAIGDAEDQDDSRMALKIAVQVASFILHVLVEEERIGKKDITLTILRRLCKLLGSLEVHGPTVELIQLRDTMEELAMMLTDPTALRSLNDLTGDLAQVQEDEEDHEAPEPDEEESVTKRCQSNTGPEHTGILNKENTQICPNGVPTKPDLRSSRASARGGALRVSTGNAPF
jgi:hypothetical protein